MGEILLVMERAQDRRLVQQFLEVHGYRVRLGWSPELEGVFDLCIIDALALDRLEKQVLARKQAEAPQFLPFLLLVTREDVSMVTRHLWRTVDELITMPVEKAELLARVAVLLRARQYSLELEASRRRLAQALEALAQRYQELFERSGDLVAVVNTDGRLCYANPSWLRTLGYAAGQIEGMSCEEAACAEDREQLRQALSEALQTGQAQSLRLRLLTSSGGMVKVTGSISATKEKRELICVLRDETERERLEEQLRQAQKLEVVGRLAGGVAHDFNNLLTVITGHCELALGQLPQGHPARASVEQILVAADKASGVTAQLLAFSKRQVLQPRVVELNQRVERLGQLLRRVIGEDIVLEMSLDPSGAWVTADPNQLDQVLMNLAINSRDAMPEGGKLRIATARVELATELPGWPDRVPAGRHVLLEVIDTGVGMDDATRLRIFEPFFTTKPYGTGLGLSTVREAISGWGGQIIVESAPGKGTRFAIYLPEQQPAPRIEEKAEAVPAARGQETILVAEDNAPLRSLLRLVLERRGYRVLEAATPSEAERLARAYGGPVHLLITDLIMPEMSGVALAERVRAARQDIKVLYMTGYIAGLSVRELPAAGSECLPKPFTPDELLRKVRAVLDRDN